MVLSPLPHQPWAFTHLQAFALPLPLLGHPHCDPRDRDGGAEPRACPVHSVRSEHRGQWRRWLAVGVDVCTRGYYPSSLWSAGPAVPLVFFHLSGI